MSTGARVGGSAHFKQLTTPVKPIGCGLYHETTLSTQAGSHVVLQGWKYPRAHRPEGTENEV